MVGDAVGIEKKDGFDYARPYWQKHGIADYAEATNFTKHPNGKEGKEFVGSAKNGSTDVYFCPDKKWYYRYPKDSSFMRERMGSRFEEWFGKGKDFGVPCAPPIIEVIGWDKSLECVDYLGVVAEDWSRRIGKE